MDRTGRAAQAALMVRHSRPEKAFWTSSVSVSYEEIGSSAFIVLIRILFGLRCLR